MAATAECHGTTPSVCVTYVAPPPARRTASMNAACFGSLGSSEREYTSSGWCFGQSMPNACAVCRNRRTARSSGSGITRNSPVPARCMASATAMFVANDSAAFAVSLANRGRNARR